MTTLKILYLKLKKDFNVKSVENKVVKIANCKTIKYTAYKTLLVFDKSSKGMLELIILILHSSVKITTVIIKQRIKAVAKLICLHWCLLSPYEDFATTK